MTPRTDKFSPRVFLGTAALCSLAFLLSSAAADGISSRSSSSSSRTSASTTENNNLQLTILHTNDLHARIQESNKYGGTCFQRSSQALRSCYGGVARRKTAIQEIRGTHSNVLLLDAGDAYQGTTFFRYYDGLEASHFMNLLGYDAMALGNHEFDNGVDGLKPFLEDVNFSVLSANINATKEPRIKDLFVPYIERTFGGETVGIVGYTTKKTNILVRPDGIKNLVFLDEVEEIRKVVEAMKARNINKIIALGHAGIEMDLKIAREVDGVDVVVGGHTNTFLVTGEAPSNEVPYGEYPLVVTQDSGAKVLVVQAFAFGKYLGFLEVSFNDGGEVTEWSGNPILLDSSVNRDPVLLAEVEEWAAPLINYTTTVVGKTRVFLDGTRKSCRLGECNIGNLITDAILYNYILMTRPTNESWSDASVVFYNSGGLRSSIPMGEVTMENILQVLPFGNTVEMIRIKGKSILDALELSAEAYNPFDANGAFLQMSGVKVVYDVTRPVGQRVREVYVKCTACIVPAYNQLDPDEEYGVLISRFLFQGGDGYSVFKDNHLVHNYIGALVSDWLIETLQQHSPVIPEVSNRITFISECENGQCEPSASTTESEEGTVPAETPTPTVKGTLSPCGATCSETSVFLLTLVFVVVVFF